MKMDIFAEIKGLKYTPLMCRALNVFDLKEIGEALSKEATFVLKIGKENKLGVSWWVSPKRTRSYPYSRVYDSLSFLGKKVTIIPLTKDEGKRGDRDFLQWDTISLMSLLGVYVIITYYEDASISQRYANKITDQEFALSHLRTEIKKLLSYQSDALHWNLTQLDNVGDIGHKALTAYGNISQKLGVEMHSRSSSENRIKQLIKGKESFMTLSRELARKAQRRESLTRQPKEKLIGTKATLTIKNYLGGFYYFTCDKIETHGKEVYLIEGKHTKTTNLPSLGDIKDGLLKMILFTNLQSIKIDDVDYNPVSILKLTTGAGFDIKSIKSAQQEVLRALGKEAKTNKFRVLINGKFLV